MSQLFSFGASIFACISMSLYFFQVVKGGSVPNPATWIIWLIIGLINTATYFFVVGGSWVQSLALIVVTTAIFLVTFYSIIRGKFARLGFLEKICLALAVLVGAIWQVTGDPHLSNLILQVVYVISFIPTIVGLHNGELREQPWPWVLSLGCYTLMIAAVISDWSDTSWVALVHPIVNGLIGNSIVVYYAITGPRKQISIPADVVSVNLS